MSSPGSAPVLWIESSIAVEGQPVPILARLLESDDRERVAAEIAQVALEARGRMDLATIRSTGFFQDVLHRHMAVTIGELPAFGKISEDLLTAQLFLTFVRVNALQPLIARHMKVGVKASGGASDEEQKFDALRRQAVVAVHELVRIGDAMSRSLSEIYEQAMQSRLDEIDHGLADLREFTRPAVATDGR